MRASDYTFSTSGVHSILKNQKKGRIFQTSHNMCLWILEEDKKQKTLSYLKSFVIMSAKNPNLAMIFTLEQRKSMHITQ